MLIIDFLCEKNPSRFSSERSETIRVKKWIFVSLFHKMMKISVFTSDKDIYGDDLVPFYNRESSRFSLADCYPK
jgi:hypothetical protein